MTATVARQSGNDAFETIRYQDCDLKIEPIAIPANAVQSNQRQLLSPILDAKIDPDLRAVQSELDKPGAIVDANAADKFFFCPMCGRSFKEAGNLRRHKETVHEKLRNFSCGDCGKSFGEAGNLRRHKETVHEKAKNYYCKDCGKAFGEAGNLKRHKETVHDRVKNFACHCGKTFAERGNLKRHVESVHSSVASGGKIVGVKRTAVDSSLASPSGVSTSHSSDSPISAPLPVTTVTYQEASQQTIDPLTTSQLQPIHESDQTQYCTVTTIIPVVTCIPNIQSLTHDQNSQQQLNDVRGLSQHQLTLQPLAPPQILTHEMPN